MPCAPKVFEGTDCVLSRTKQPRGSKLGCGEQGCVYGLVGNKVIKESFLKSKKAKEQWTSEACVGQYLGSLGIAPKIYDFYFCKGAGYIVMDALRDAQILPDGKVLRVKTKDHGVIDHVKQLSIAFQNAFVYDLALMIEHGFIHMDNHIGNIGFINGTKPILFDFGFTQQRTWDSDLDKLKALAFSLFQILEHCPLKELDSSGPIWTISAHLATIDTISIADAKKLWSQILQKKYSPKNNVLLSDVHQYSKGFSLKLLQQKYSSLSNLDIYIGCDAYCYVLTRPNIYSQDLYNTIYDVRKNKFFH